MSACAGVERELRALNLPDDDIKEILQIVSSKLKEQIRKNDPEIQEMEAQLRSSLDQLLQSETGYVNNLNTILKTYYYPLLSGVVKIKTPVLVTIFSNIEVIAGLHQDLLDKLTKAKEEFPKIKIGELLSDSVNSMQVYTQYVNNFSASLNQLQEERERSKAFNQFLISCEESNPMPLDALLSFPLNRIPHYRGVLTGILASTPRNGPDYVRLVQVNEDLSNLQEYLNESKTQSDNMAQVFKIESKISGREYALNDLHRVFKKEGPILVVGSDKKPKESYAFLFNDIIVITKKVPQKAQYRYKQSYPLQYGSVSPLEGLTIEVKSPSCKEPLNLVAVNAESKREWVGAILDVLAKMERTKVFGVTINELMSREPEGSEIPKIIKDLISHLEKHALRVPGLFRISGSSTTINSVISQFDRGIKVDISKLDNNVVSGVLKQFLRTLKEPLIPFDKFDALLECHDAENQLEAIKNLLSQIPSTNVLILKRLMQLLVKVASHSAENKMTPSNLAIVIGPNLPRERVATTFGEINITTKVSPLVQLMIEKYSEIFPKDPPPTFSKAVPRSSTIGPAKSVSSASMMGSRRVKRDRKALATSNPDPRAKPPPRPPRRPTISGPPTTPSNPTPSKGIPPETVKEPQTEEETCARCSKGIGEEFIELCDKMYHPECFLCYQCSRELTNGYFKYEGNPVCKECRRKSKAPKN